MSPPIFVPHVGSTASWLGYTQQRGAYQVMLHFWVAGTETINKVTVVFIDEGQKLYLRHNRFWELLKLDKHQQPWQKRNLKLLVAVTYGVHASGYRAVATQDNAALMDSILLSMRQLNIEELGQLVTRMGGGLAAQELVAARDLAAKKQAAAGGAGINVVSQQNSSVQATGSGGAEGAASGSSTPGQQHVGALATGSGGAEGALTAELPWWLYGTPYKVPTRQIVTARPVASGQGAPAVSHPSAALLDDAAMSLCFSWDEFLDLVASWSRACSIKLNTNVLTYIYILTAGQVRCCRLYCLLAFCCKSQHASKHVPA